MGSAWRAGRGGGWDGRRPGPPWTFVGLVLLLVQVVGTSGAARRQGAAEALDRLAYLLVVLGPLAWIGLRRRRIVVVAAVAVGAAACYLGLGYPGGPVVATAGLSLVVAVAQGRRVAAWVVGAGGYAVWLTVCLASGHEPTWARAVGYAAWLVVVLLVGEGPRYRAGQMAAARRARAAEQQATVAEQQAAASAERLALARDLHDTIGHSLSMIAVQAGVALHLLDEHPEQARPALTAIRTASREALEEVRSTLAVLRSDAAERPEAPGLDRLPELVEAARLGGLDVTLQLEASAGAVTGPVEAAAYRIVQEALTNVTRHAAASRAWVVVRRAGDALAVEVTDDGSGPGSAVVEGGGLTGMRERAAALGGEVVTGTRPAGGFRVAVHLPFDNSTAPRSAAVS